MHGFGAGPPVASAKPFSNPVKPYSKRKVCVDGKVMITASIARHLPVPGRATPPKQRLDLKTVRDLGRLDSPSRYGHDSAYAASLGCRSPRRSS